MKSDKVRVYSFRLSNENEDERAAREVIEYYKSQGYTLREIITGFLLDDRSVYIASSEQRTNEKILNLLLRLEKILENGVVMAKDGSKRVELDHDMNKLFDSVFKTITGDQIE